MPSEPGETMLLEVTGETALGAGANDVRQLLPMHLGIAYRRAREGSPLQGFQELVRASRAMPMGGRLAAAMVQLGIKAKAQHSAALLITAGVDDTDERPRVLRQLARLHRKSGQPARAQEVLEQLLETEPDDRRARAVLHVLLLRQQRYDTLDTSLELATKAAVRRGALKEASRLALQRARLWAETLDDPSRAALRAMQAAQLAEQADDLSGAFLLRLLWLRCLARAKAPKRSLEEAAKAVLSLGDRVGQAESARALVEELDLQDSVAAITRSIEAPVPPAPMQRRRSTQLELVAVAEALPASGAQAAAILAAAAREVPDPHATLKLEALLIQRGAWRELAEFYRSNIGRAQTPQERARWGEKLAELLETELDDLDGAAQAWAQVVSATGDSRAVEEQVRLLAKQQDSLAVRDALDEGVRQAQAPAERARSLVLRAEEALNRREVAAARADYEAALEVAPGFPLAAAGLAELAALQGDLEPVRVLEAALAKLPRRSSGRGDLFRRLARLADAPVHDSKLARASWAEVLAELPGDEEATLRSLSLLRAANDDAGLESLIRDTLARTPRGPQARSLRLELVTRLERAGRDDEALEQLKKACKAEPGHREAWLLYAERLERRSRGSEAAWALEHAATATDDAAERLKLWSRLAELMRDVVGDDEKAEVFDARAAKLRRELMHNTPEGVIAPPPSTPMRPMPLPGGPLVIPPRRNIRAKVPPARVRPSPPPPPVPSPPVLARTKNPFGEADDPGETTGELVVEPTVTPARVPLEPPRKTAELPLELGDPDAVIPSSFGPAPSTLLTAERRTLFERVSGAPLEPEGYRLLAEHYDSASDATRSSLMLEIARALEGDPHAMPRSPRLILTASDRLGLKHKSLRGEGAELLALVGTALCRLNPAKGKEGGSDEEFSLTQGKGARGVAEALLASVRVLGLRSPDVFLSHDPGPPLSLVYTSEPRILVGRQAVKKEHPDAELRFFAGRTLFTLEPELLVLRNLRREQLLRGLVFVSQVVDNRASPVEQKLLRDSVPPRSWERLKQLVRTVGSRLDLAQLAEGARHSANRAGLMVCGGIAPAVASLKAKKALPSEMIELVRFAASERYLQLRNRHLARK